MKKLQGKTARVERHRQNGRQSRTARRQAGYRILIRVRDDKKGKKASRILIRVVDTDTDTRPDRIGYAASINGIISTSTAAMRCNGVSDNGDGANACADARV